MLSVIASNLLSVAGVAYLVPGSFAWSPVDLTVLALYFGFMLATAFVSGRRATGATLGVLIVLYGLDLILNVSGG